MKRNELNLTACSVALLGSVLTSLAFSLVPVPAEARGVLDTRIEDERRLREQDRSFLKQHERLAQEYEQRLRYYSQNGGNGNAVAVFENAITHFRGETSTARGKRKMPRPPLPETSVVAPVP